MSEKKVLRIAVVGAGPSGLCCAKNALDSGHDVTVYEQNSVIGGTWVYTDHVGKDELGVPIHSSMYKGVVTNVPIESMGYLNYPFPKKQRSFVHHEEVLSFFQSYANDFDLHRVIKFRNKVEIIRPLGEERWEVLSKDLLTSVYDTKQFDAIFLCNGHYSVPSIPEYDGLNQFTGHKMHSHDYRRPDQFSGETVLIIGAGPSGKDIMYEIAPTAKRVLLSHHRDLSKNTLPSNTKLVGDVKCFKTNSVQFFNDEEESITCILFCTGYKFSFPFLSVDCGLCVKDGFLVQPLYKHLININRPTMAIVGLQICAYTFMYDLQARLCLRYWSDEIPLPSKERMFEDFRVESERRKENGSSVRQSHLLNKDQTAYLRQLSELGQMIKMPEVLLKIYEDCNDLRIQYPDTYREFNYKIIDDETFERSHISDNQ